MSILRNIGRWFNGNAAPHHVERKIWTEQEVGELESLAKDKVKQVELTEKANAAQVKIKLSNMKIRAMNEAADLVIDTSLKEYEKFDRQDRGRIREQTQKQVQSELSNYVKRLKGAAKE